MRERKFAAENRGSRANPRCYYVGSTKHSCECRLGQHRRYSQGSGHYYCSCGKKPKKINFRDEGGKTRGNKFAGKYWTALEPDLFGFINPIATREKAEKIEHDLAEYLKKQGAAVWQR